jgi:hypothetical protein
MCLAHTLTPHPDPSPRGECTFALAGPELAPRSAAVTARMWYGQMSCRWGDAFSFDKRGRSIEIKTLCGSDVNAHA